MSPVGLVHTDQVMYIHGTIYKYVLNSIGLILLMAPFCIDHLLASTQNENNSN